MTSRLANQFEYKLFIILWFCTLTYGYISNLGTADDQKRSQTITSKRIQIATAAAQKKNNKIYERKDRLPSVSSTNVSIRQIFDVLLLPTKSTKRPYSENIIKFNNFLITQVNTRLSISEAFESISLSFEFIYYFAFLQLVTWSTIFPSAHQL